MSWAARAASLCSRRRPLAHLAGTNEKKDKRHTRRPLSAEDLRGLIRAALESERVFRSLDGPARALLYCVACASRFRAGELATLAPIAFDLDAGRPTVTLAAVHAKTGQAAEQPLPPDLVEPLRAFQADRPARVPVWPGGWVDNAADMLRTDLDAAGIPYVVDGPEGPEYADFHSLRHSFIALLNKSGATLKEAMQLAPHSDPRLTMAVYGRARRHDLDEAVGRLPSLLSTPAAGPQERQKVAATGTDGAAPGDLFALGLRKHGAGCPR